MNAIITVKDMSLWYAEHQALKRVSMDIPSKGLTAFIGPSGCGKSTFLKTLNRMNDLVPGVRITGQVKYQGKSIFAKDVDVNQLRRQVGMVFQKPNPFPMSIYDNVAYGPRTHGITARGQLDQIVERALRRAAIWDEVKDRLKKNALGLSGGQQQRLCIPCPGGGAQGAADGRAHLRAGPYFHRPHRGSGHRAESALHHHHGHPQHAAGPSGV